MIGFRIRRRTRSVPADWVQRYAGLPVAAVSDSMSRMFAGGARLRPMHAGGMLAGPAVTVRCRPGDNLMFQKALDLAEPGDVVVVDGGGALENALAGELMVAHAQKRGLAGMVIFGAIRDAAVLAAGDFPVYAAGVTHRGPYKDGPGEINVPVSLDGMVVEPGDLVLGDADGVLVVPYAELQPVHAAAIRKIEAETQQLQAIAEGRNQRGWIDETLQRLGCPPDPED